MCVLATGYNGGYLSPEAFQDGTSILMGTVKLDPAKKPKAADWAIGVGRVASPAAVTAKMPASIHDGDRRADSDPD